MTCTLRLFFKVLLRVIFIAHVNRLTFHLRLDSCRGFVFGLDLRLVLRLDLRLVFGLVFGLVFDLDLSILSLLLRLVFRNQTIEWVRFFCDHFDFFGLCKLKTPWRRRSYP